MTRNKGASSIVALFTRISVPGGVKKRIAIRSDAQLAMRAHQFMLKNTLKVLVSSPALTFQIWVAGELQHLNSGDPLSPYQAQLRLQRGDSLGDRMAYTIGYNASNGAKTVLIGSDCPAMNVDYIQAAFSCLNTGADLVVGPAEDGGYVLIGMHELHLPIFRGIDWGSSRVLKQTLKVARDMGLNVCLLDTLSDVDRVEDLINLIGFDVLAQPDQLMESGDASR